MNGEIMSAVYLGLLFASEIIDTEQFVNKLYNKKKHS